VIKVLFDTSVLIASILVNHEQHSACIPWLTRVKRGEIQGFIGTHTLAELGSSVCVMQWTGVIRDGTPI
jgi:predicted nucleic acid-binding protein